MRRRTLLQLIAAGLAWPLLRIRLSAASAELTDTDVAMLREIAPTVLPSALGTKGATDAVDQFVDWVRGYREGVPLSHGYGFPRLIRTGPSPAARYGEQMAALRKAALARGGRFGALSLEQRRAVLEDAFKQSGVTALPSRPSGTHVIADLMAHYFRGSGANDLCYSAHIGRNSYRAIQVTTVRPAPMSPRQG